MTPIDPALVDGGWWLVKRQNEHEIVYVDDGAVWHIGCDYPLGTPVEYCADVWAMFIRRLDLEKLAEQ